MMLPIDRDPFAQMSAKFIRTFYFEPAGKLLEMEKVHIQYWLASAKLICRWLEGILKLINELEAKGK